MEWRVIVFVSFLALVLAVTAMVWVTILETKVGQHEAQLRVLKSDIDNIERRFGLDYIIPQEESIDEIRN